MELTQLIWIEKYRPSVFEDLILDKKTTLLNYLNNPALVPSFIFYSSRPGTGKTSTAKIIANYLQSDMLSINSSDERGIDTIREKINIFAKSLSTNPNSKRCIFMDEADGLTRPAQDSLRNLMEEYSDNCFFIFTANDINKIIDPIRSRCQVINFDSPSKIDILARLIDICRKEKLEIEEDNLMKIIECYYPDIRKMINFLQLSSTENCKDFYLPDESFEDFLKLLYEQKVTDIYNKVYSGDFEIMAFNKWLFRKLFDKYQTKDFDICRDISILLADTEKYVNMGANLEIIFLANILQISDIMKKRQYKC